MAKRKNSPYRRIYEQNYGPIPKDCDGRTYDVHHIDGNSDNNDPANLIALSIQEHYNVHYDRGDLTACLAISMRMNKTPEELSELQKERVRNGTHNFLGPETNNTRVARGEHPLQRRLDGTSLTMDRVEDGTHHWLGGELQREMQNARVEDGTHHWLGPDVNNKRIAAGTHHLLGGEVQRRSANERVANGTHPLLGGEVQRRSNKERLENGTHHLVGGKYQMEQLRNGTHPSQIKWTCEECGKSGSGSANYNRWHGKNCKMKK